MAAIKNIALITTSTRKSRVGPQITSGMKLNVVNTRPALGFHGGVGDDLWLPGAGKLGDDTKKDIIAETPIILNSFGELKDLMEKQVPKDSQK
ncbi:nadph-dependent fmn reductase [Fusarium agapanthi]|uniref:Nadph-dependent fmn reductase n=1 Tax=Fusarium agapanthi TaxID=1803897 RepID=A0A9P5BJY2_9HYPO|nr:nadph-dependent fmn reductase [Fusarium agapanthi]